jgi:hypothetical protein
MNSTAISTFDASTPLVKAIAFGQKFNGQSLTGAVLDITQSFDKATHFHEFTEAGGAILGYVMRNPEMYVIEKFFSGPDDAMVYAADAQALDKCDRDIGAVILTREIFDSVRWGLSPEKEF